MEFLTNLDRKNLWNQPVYAQFLAEIDPFRDLQYFRKYLAYDGGNSFWTKPCPEPNLSDEFWQLVLSKLPDEKLQLAATRLAAAIIRTAPDPSKLLFVAILRGGVPIADWLCRLLPGSVAVALSLFVGIGIDRVALQKVRSHYPDRQVIFVDGWTGKGGVAKELSKLEIGPLAVLIDPWGWADFSGAVDDLFCPTACFTGVATLGFSSGFYVDDRSLFSSYLFPEAYCRPKLVTTWQNSCPQLPSTAPPKKQRFWLETDLRIHSNEVCRGLMNANPDTLYFADDRVYVREHYSLILALAERRGVNIVYEAKHLADYQTRVACSFQK
ncbi:MAG: hypothetical protein EBE86_026785 [Hormoscilla sp. GUM202]|nr:hypothetical protein [Hormoscilla sp. GUM202]